ncbi:hypothetical protein RA086_03860 [Lactiplantibacillus sp. WILCCON 0030]|uniref:Uncharacterized protein n=1 Tax=Lactiplantibacillus brownii TaxID=3069269 RepID=A0ABU1A756_9LACO|nr:hypothetical protein [Lactiplantibacillus brownii]MDQ7936782.1 hypothetical protein [Lactiplantibacillus brownii]
MAAKIVLLVQSTQNNPDHLYIVGYPIFEVTATGELKLAEDQAKHGLVARIKLSSAGVVYTIHFENDRMQQIKLKNVSQADANPTGLSISNLLAAYHYQLPNQLTQLSDFQEDFSKVFSHVTTLTSIPKHYIVIDCEFGPFFRKHFVNGSFQWQPTKINGADATVFQLAALSYVAGTQTTVFFNHYLDFPSFLPERKLAALDATQLALATFERQAEPLTVLKKFIAQVLVPQLPLVFWDQAYDLRSLRWLIAQYYQKLTASEQATVNQPLTVFDGEQYTNLVINRSNKHALTTTHDLPLNGVAGLLNIINPQQHNALWDAQTTHHVIHKMAIIQAATPEILTLPQPVKPAIHKAEQIDGQETKHQLVRRLRTAGKTYREIASRAGISISGVNYILKKTSQAVG